MIAMRSVFGSYRTKSIRTKWLMQKWQQNFVGLQAGEERKGSIASQAEDCCMETMVEQYFAMGADQARCKFEAMCQVSFKKFEACAPPAQMPGKGGGRRNSEDEQEQDKASQQLGVVSVKREQ